MSPDTNGQRCVSEREPELGLGLVLRVAEGRIAVSFPATGEERLYPLGTAVLQRIRFQPGDRLTTRGGGEFVIASVEEENGILIYRDGTGQRVRESEISDRAGVNSPLDRLLAGRADEGEVFHLRYRARHTQARLLQSEVRGFLGGRIQLIPHQLHVAREVALRPLPRVLLADEVGLGKTIEACLIVQRLLAVGRASRVLILVPESLIHQWFVELLRRFNLWFSILDEERCLAQEAGDPGTNPFLAAQLVLSGTGFLAAQPERREQAVAAGWDVLVVDEAHHLAWKPGSISPEYALVEKLAARSEGLLLLTATPTQLGLEGHFARLRLLDPNRYDSFERFLDENRRYGSVATAAERLIEGGRLDDTDEVALRSIFDRDPDGIDRRLAALAAGRPNARAALLRTLLDMHGPGRVIFRNTRAAMSGFPPRRFHPVPLSAPEPAETLLARIAREVRAEEAPADEQEIRYAYKDDPRLDWLADFLVRIRPEKVLLICRSQRKVAAIEAALKERIGLGAAVFHEGQPLVQRDRQAAWFAEPSGAQVLICSEIGSEGRNFQFAHHLVLFDLPLNPGLVEQRIGRLDRIGQTKTIAIHVPYISGSAGECIAAWYHRGLGAFETSLAGGEEMEAAFRDRILALALDFGAAAPVRRRTGPAELEALIAETAVQRERLAERLRQGRDRLLELASFDATAAGRLVEQVRTAGDDPDLRRLLYDVLDHFGVRVKEHEEGDLFLDPSHAFVESFPSLPADGMLATFSRERAIAREDIRFLSADHPLIRDAIDLLVDGPAGTTAFSRIRARSPNLLLEAVFVLEAVADRRWRADQFLAPTPVRVLVDVRRRDWTGERDAAAVADDAEDGDLPRFLENEAFDPALIRGLLEFAAERAESRADRLKAGATERASALLGSERQRLAELGRINDHVRPEEIAWADEQLRQVTAAIGQARLRLDSLRLILEEPA